MTVLTRSDIFAVEENTSHCTHLFFFFITLRCFVTRRLRKLWVPVKHSRINEQHCSCAGFDSALLYWWLICLIDTLSAGCRESLGLWCHHFKWEPVCWCCLVGYSHLTLFGAVILKQWVAPPSVICFEYTLGFVCVKPGVHGVGVHISEHKDLQPDLVLMYCQILSLALITTNLSLIKRCCLLR